MFNLGWSIDDLSRFSESGRNLLVEIVAVQELMEDVNTDLVSCNIAKRLTNISERLLIFIKVIYLVVHRYM